MAKVAGTRVIQPIVPNDTDDRYPTHKDLYGHGGYKSVSDLGERDLIPIERQKIGMAVYVVSDTKVYILSVCSETLDNSCWNELILGSESAVIVQPLPPVSPSIGTLWLNTMTGKILIFTGTIWEHFVFSSQMSDNAGDLIINGGYF